MLRVLTNRAFRAALYVEAAGVLLVAEEAGLTGEAEREELTAGGIFGIVGCDEVRAGEVALVAVSARPGVREAGKLDFVRMHLA